MGLEFPEEVKWLLPIVVGSSWPEGDEDKLRALADAWRQAGEGIDEVLASANQGAQTAKSSMEGETQQAFAELWAKIGEGGEAALAKLREACNNNGESCDNTALEIEHTKLTIIFSLIALAIQIAIMIASAFVSFGASTAGIVPAQMLTRTAVQMIFRQLITSILRNVAIELGTSLAIEGVVQGIQIASGERDGLDRGKFGQAAVSGLIGGVTGGVVETGFAVKGIAKGVGGAAGEAAGDVAGNAAGEAASAAGEAASKSLGDAVKSAGKAMGSEAVEGAAEGALGSAAEQVLTGDKPFSWEEVGKGAVSGGVTGGVMGGATDAARSVADAKAASAAASSVNESVDSAGDAARSASESASAAGAAASNGAAPPAATSSGGGGSSTGDGGGSSSTGSAHSASTPSGTTAQSTAPPMAPPAPGDAPTGGGQSGAAGAAAGQGSLGGQSAGGSAPAGGGVPAGGGSPGMSQAGGGSAPGGSAPAGGGMRPTAGGLGNTSFGGASPGAAFGGSSGPSPSPGPSHASAPGPSALSPSSPGPSTSNGPSAAGSAQPNSPHSAVSGSSTPNPASGTAPHTSAPGGQPTAGSVQAGGPGTPAHGPAQGVSPTRGTPEGSATPGSATPHRPSTPDYPAQVSAQGFGPAPAAPARPTWSLDTPSPRPSNSPSPLDGLGGATHQPGQPPAPPGHVAPSPPQAAPGQPATVQRGNPPAAQPPQTGSGRVPPPGAPSWGRPEAPTAPGDGRPGRNVQPPERGTGDGAPDHARRPVGTSSPSSPSPEGARPAQDGVTGPPEQAPADRHLASGGSSRPRDLLDDPKQTEWAREAYEHFRRDGQDIDDIARSTEGFVREDGEVGFSSEEIADIKKHLFDSEHLIEDYETGEVVRRAFDPDPDIADAWIRMRNGNPLPEDLVLLQHELRELTYLRDNPGVTYQEAHRHANELHNWQSQVPPATRENYEIHRENADGSDRVLQEDQRGRADDPLQLRPGTRPDGPSPDLRQDHAPLDPAGRPDRSRVPGGVQEDHHHVPGTGNLAGEGHARQLNPEPGSATRPGGLDEHRPPRHSGARSDDPPASRDSNGPLAERPAGESTNPSPGRETGDAEPARPDTSRPNQPSSTTPSDGQGVVPRPPGYSPAGHAAPPSPNPAPAPGTPHLPHAVPVQGGNPPANGHSPQAGAPLRQTTPHPGSAEPSPLRPGPQQPGVLPHAAGASQLPASPHHRWGSQLPERPSYQSNRGSAPHPPSTPASLAAERPPANPWDHSLHRNGETSADMDLPRLLRWRLRGDADYITPNECGVMIMKEPPERAKLFTPVPPDPNRFTIQVHADPTSAYLGDRKLSAKDLADIIKGTPGYVPGTPVRMVACNAGRPLPDGSPNLAQQLSQHLGVEVLAGDQTVWADPHGISTAASSQMLKDTFGVPTPRFDQPGHWHVFRPDGGPPITHPSPHPPGHVTEFEKARQHSERNIRSGTWHPDDPFLPKELRHPGGGPNAEPVRFVDPHNRVWDGHVGPYGHPVWHQVTDPHGNVTPHGRFDQQGRFVPGHYENGRLVDNGHYAPNGGWVGKGRLGEQNRWIPMEFDGTHLRDAGRFDAGGRWFSAGQYDASGAWHPDGRFDPNSGRWIPNSPSRPGAHPGTAPPGPGPHAGQPNPGQSPPPGQGPHPGQGLNPSPGQPPGQSPSGQGPRQPGHTPVNPAAGGPAPTAVTARPDGAGPAVSHTPGVPGSPTPGFPQRQASQDSSPQPGEGRTAEPPARGVSDWGQQPPAASPGRTEVRAQVPAETPNQAPRRSTPESMAQEPAHDRANDVSWEKRGKIDLPPDVDAKLAHTRDGLQSIRGFNRSIDDRGCIHPTEAGLTLIKQGRGPYYNRTIGTAVPDPQRFTVEAHGSADGVMVGNTPITATDLADILRASPGYQEGTPVRLLACNTGAERPGDPNFAQQLSQELGVEVLAPSTKAWVDDFGNVYASKTQAEFDDATGSPQPTHKQPGQWVSHSPDGTTATHDSPYPPGHSPEWTRKTPGTGTEFRPGAAERRGDGSSGGPDEPDDVGVGPRPNGPVRPDGSPQQPGSPQPATPQQGWPQQGTPQHPAPPAPGIGGPAGGPPGTPPGPPGTPWQPGPYPSAPGSHRPSHPRPGHPVPPVQGFPPAPRPGGPMQPPGPRPQGNVPPPAHPPRQPGRGTPPQVGTPGRPVPPSARPTGPPPPEPRFPNQPRPPQTSSTQGPPPPGPQPRPGQRHPQNPAAAPQHPQPPAVPGQHPTPETPNARQRPTPPPQPRRDGFVSHADGGLGQPPRYSGGRSDDPPVPGDDGSRGTPTGEIAQPGAGQDGIDPARYLAKPEVVDALTRANDTVVKVDGHEMPLGDAIRRMLPENPELVRLMAGHDYLENSLLARPKTIHSLLENPRALSILEDAVREIDERGPEAINADNESDSGPLPTPLTSEQREVARRVLDGTENYTDRDRRQSGFEFSRKHDASYREKYLQRLYASAAEAQGELNDVAREIAEDTGGAPGFRPGPKEKGRVLDKIAENDGDVSKFTDMAGAKIQFDRLQGLFDAFGRLSEDDRIQIVRCKDRFAKPQGSGYRDVLMNVRMSNGHVAELRLHLRGIDEVAKYEHALYEVRRDLEALANDQERAFTAEEMALDNAIIVKVRERFWSALQSGI